RRDHRGGAAVHRELADALRTECAVRVRLAEEHDVDRGRIDEGRDDVVRELLIPDAAVLPAHLLEERPPERLQHAALDLTFREPRMHWVPDLRGDRRLHGTHL